LATIIFTGYPSRAQQYLADKLEKEGWFDETGWEIPNWTFSPASTITVGKGVFWAGDAWEKAYQMSKYRGEKSHLDLDPKEVKDLPAPYQHIYAVNQNLSNHKHFLMMARVERTRGAVTARRLFHQAEKLDNVGDYDQAKPIYEDPAAFGPPTSWDSPKDKATGWRKVLLDNEDYAAEDDIQQETFIMQHQYKHSLQELAGPYYKQLVVMNDALGQSALWPANMPFGFRMPWYTPSIQLHRRLHAQVQGPFDRLNAKGERFIDEENEAAARSSLGLYDFRMLQMRMTMTPDKNEEMMNKMKARKMGGG
jgi:hypothetical protein